MYVMTERMAGGGGGQEGPGKGDRRGRVSTVVTMHCMMSS